MAYHFRNLVFEGGGVKGVAYVGAMEVLESKGILKEIKRVGGTSAGAINALLLGLNYSIEETREILMQLDFKNFLDDSWGVIRDTRRLIEEYGWYKGDFFYQWVADRIESKTGKSKATFAEVQSMGKFRDLYFIGTNLSTHFSEVFSAEETPKMPLADAVRISMSIPLFFAAQSMKRNIYVDGGVVNNYPVKLFDRQKYVEQELSSPDYYQSYNANLGAAEKGNPLVYNKETLGFRLDSSKEIAVFRDHAEPEHHKIKDFFDYTLNLIETILAVQDDQHLHSDDWHRTIYVDTLGVGTTDFEISDSMKEKLIQSGRENTEKYFVWYDNEENQPANRPSPPVG